MAHENASFTTVSPANSFIGNFTPEDGSTVGVGMPVSINFNKAITNKAAVQKAITVSSSSGQEVVGHWFGDTAAGLPSREVLEGRLHRHPEARPRRRRGRARGVYGVQQKTVTFNIGRNQVSIVDAKTKHDEGHAGRQDHQDHPDLRRLARRTPTYNGQMVISEKFKETRMNGATVGFTTTTARASTTSRTCRTPCG